MAAAENMARPLTDPTGEAALPVPEAAARDEVGVEGLTDAPEAPWGAPEAPEAAAELGAPLETGAPLLAGAIVALGAGACNKQVSKGKKIHSCRKDRHWRRGKHSAWGHSWRTWAYGRCKGATGWGRATQGAAGRW